MENSPFVAVNMISPLYTIALTYKKEKRHIFIPPYRKVRGKVISSFITPIQTSWKMEKQENGKMNFFFKFFYLLKLKKYAIPPQAFELPSREIYRLLDVLLFLVRFYFWTSDAAEIRVEVFTMSFRRGNNNDDRADSTRYAKKTESQGKRSRKRNSNG